MHYAFIDGGGVLIAHGFTERNGDGDTRLEVAEDFSLTPRAWRWTGTDWEAYAPPVVRVATARQFKAALAIALPTLIDESDVASPNLPASIESALAGLPTPLSDEQRIIARSTWANMTVVPEDDPMLALFRQALGKTEADIAAVFDIALSIT